MNTVIETFTAPEIKYALVAPMLIVLTGAVLSVLVEAFVGRAQRRVVQLVLVGVVLLLALVQTVRLAGTNELAAAGHRGHRRPGSVHAGQHPADRHGLGAADGRAQGGPRRRRFRPPGIGPAGQRR
ncbi:MAG: hypothetical protein V9E82_14460 [Candidatus Nanopelagicales bacterium]